jgi:hypothetical protein
MKAFFVLFAGLGALVWLGWWLLLAVAVLVAILGGIILWLRHVKVTDDRQREEAGLRRRADQQQAWRLAGDPRGFYGEYPPAI